MNTDPRDLDSALDTVLDTSPTPTPTPREQVAREAQDFAESIVDTVREPLLVLDEDLRVVTANRAFRNTFRVSAGETQGTLVYELGNGQWNIAALRHLLEAILPEHTHFDDFEVEHVFPRIGRKVMLLNARKLYRPGNNTTMLLLAIEDITERRQAEEEVWASQQVAQAAQDLLTTTLHSIGDAVIATDMRGCITFLNPVAETLTGWSAQEALGHDHTDVFHIVSEETRERSPSPVSKVLRHGVIAGLANPTALIRKDGSEISISDSSAPIRDAAGTLLGVVLVFRDISARRAAEARLQARYEREHRIAEVLQRPLTLEVPENAFPGLAVATLYEPALEAAVRTIQLKDVLRAFTREYPHSPAAIVARLNDFTCDTHVFDDVGESFSCLSLAILNPETGEGSLVSAGCEPALIVRADGTTQEMEVSGLPLGVERNELYMARPFVLHVGDTLVLVTDGITEARRRRREKGASAEFLGYEGMTALAKDALGRERESLPLRDAAALILAGAHAFAGGGRLGDDACIVLVRRHGVDRQRRKPTMSSSSSSNISTPKTPKTPKSAR